MIIPLGEIGLTALAIQNDELVAFPTESSYGLGAKASSEAALERLFDLKRRERNKPPPVLIANLGMLQGLVSEVSPHARLLMERFWPGPLTLVLPAHPQLSELLVLDGGVGVRWSPHPVAQALVSRAGAPITATSANPAGRSAAMIAFEVRNYFGDDLLVLDGGPAGGAPPSTVARIKRNGALEVLRAGALDPSLLES